MGAERKAGATAPELDTTRRGRTAAPVSRPGWPLARRVLGGVFAVVVAALVVNLARRVDWAQALTSLQALPSGVVLGAGALALASYAVCSTYDLFGRAHTRHGLPVWRVMTINFVSCAFNLNLGSLIGGVALRYRLYSRQGLAPEVTTRVLALSWLTNWLGYFAVGGLALLLWPPSLPPDWGLSHGGLPLVGGAMLLAALAYLGLCVARAGREWHWRGHRTGLPGVGVALLQVAVAAVNWLLVAAVCWTLLQRRVEYATVLGVLLIAALAGVVTRVPAGLGVLEAVFVVLLSHRLPRHDILAALLAYRALYYLGPLLLAGAVFFVIDVRRRKPPPSPRRCGPAANPPRAALQGAAAAPRP